MAFLILSTGCRRTVAVPRGRWCCRCWRWWWCWRYSNRGCVAAAAATMLAVQVQVQVQAKLQACCCPAPRSWLANPGAAFAEAAAAAVWWCRGGGKGTAPPGPKEYEWKYVVAPEVNRVSSAIESAMRGFPFSSRRNPLASSVRKILLL